MMNSAAADTSSMVSFARSTSLMHSSDPLPAPSTTSVPWRTKTFGMDSMARAQLGPVEQMNDPIVAAPFECDRLLRKDDVRSHQPRLLACSLHEKATVDAVGKPGIVPDQRARAGLPARDGPFEHHRFEPLG